MKEIQNIAASVKEGLRNISIQTGKEFQSVIRQYIQLVMKHLEMLRRQYG